MLELFFPIRTAIWVHVLYFPSLMLMLWILYRSLVVLMTPIEEDSLELAQMLEMRIAIAFGIFYFLRNVMACYKQYTNKNKAHHTTSTRFQYQVAA